MQQWEYMIQEVDSGVIARASLRILGENGWELISIIKDPANQKGYIYFFKRPK
jgi:hypothetical protein